MFITEELYNQSLLSLGIVKTKKTGIKKIITSFTKGDVKDPDRISSKNNALIFLIEQHIIEKNVIIPIKDQCPICGGRGFEVQFFDVVSEKCKLVISIDSSTGKRTYSGCNGTGFKIDGCTRCNETGQIGELVCGTCKGRGTYLYKKTDKFPGKKCLICKGTGVVKKLNQTNDIKKISFCEKCKGAGIFSTFGFPVIDPQMGEILKSNLKITKEASLE